MACSRLPMRAQDMREQVRAIQALMKLVMREGEHYGSLPGSRKPSLWKAGAEKLCVAFHIAPSFVIEDLSTPEQARYRVCCVGTHQVTGIRLGEGLGACSSMESRYKWRRASDEEFERTPKARRRFKYCYDRDKGRYFELKQVRAEHEDIENTILKMACKRAHVAMILNVTAASDIFTQDIEDVPELLETEDALRAPLVAEPKRKSEKSAEGAGTAEGTAKARKTEGVHAEASGSTGGKDEEVLKPGQLRVLRARLASVGLSEDALSKQFGSPLSSLASSRFKEIAAWIRLGTKKAA